MKPRYSFSSRHTGKLTNIRRQKKKFPEILQEVLIESDIILEIVDARFFKEMKNKEIQKFAKKKKKKHLFILNKYDLLDKKITPTNYLIPISCKTNQNKKLLHNTLKKLSSQIKSQKKERIIIGIVGYPNTGKSSLINLLTKQKSAGVSHDAGYTKGLQKIKYSKDILLIDSPGVIPKEEYSQEKIEKIAKHTRFSSRSYSQVKEPEMIVSRIMQEYPQILEKHYNLNTSSNPEQLIEELGKKLNFLKSKAQVDEDKTARKIIKDFQDGKIKLN